MGICRSLPAFRFATVGLLVAFFVFPTFILTHPLLAATREWKDNQGRTVTAEYGGIEAGMVSLKLENGKVVPFPFKRLSTADQDWIKKAFRSSPENVAEQIDAYITSALEKAGRTPNPKTTDSQFVRRAYLEITGAIPAYEQASRFLESTDPDKRKKLIDWLLDSEEYVSHTFNWYAGQLRVISKLRDFIHYENYIAWIKDSIRDDVPWDQFVRRLIEAEGTIFEDPANGWYLRDAGMPLNNLSASVSLFLGTEITCAQCHDHPFEDWTQMDFYSLAAFLGQRKDNLGFRDPDYNKMYNANLARIEEEVRTLKSDPDFGYDNRIRLMLNFNKMASKDVPELALKLPHDYKYEDAEPEEVVEPRTLFGEDIRAEDYDSPRQAFAVWLTSSENPRFSIAIANRVWDWAFGLPLHNPVDNLANLKRAQNPELLQFLGESLEGMDFSLKELRRAIYYSEAWQREATHGGVTEAEIGKNEYPFPGPLLRRMTAEQVWDSFMTLLVTDPYDLRRDVADDLTEATRMDVSKVKGDEALAMADEATRIMKATVNGKAPSVEAAAVQPEKYGLVYRENGDLLRDYGDYFIRASEMRQPAPASHFLRSWGQADRETPDNGSDIGSVPQILYMLNGYLTHKLAKEDSMIFQKAGGERATGEKLDQIYLSILSRPAEGSEKAICYKAIRGSEEGYADLIWALINSREFLFVQ